MIVTEQKFSVSLARSRADIVGILTSRPSTWFRPFLQLAAGQVVDRVPLAMHPTGPWYRVGGLENVQGEATDVTLTWWPHLEGDLFTRFRGGFTVIDTDGGCTLTISGVTTGGRDTRNAAALGSLLRLLGAAVSADQPGGG
jgi:hypothetical protein